ncbi:MAG: hypothetical protein JRF33_26185, partial [Deltaproteobacteria bacterium]|nr:hypothetical protein [Deltaproteobacteria bacterium]
MGLGAVPALAQNPPADFWNKYNGTYDTGRNFLKNTGRGSGSVGGNKGAYTFSWPIPLPAGRRGVQPSLSLTYSSSGGRSHLGEGWSMPSPHIARSTNFGTPSYNDQDIFEFHDASGTSHPMVPVEEVGDEIRYRFLRESAFSIARRDTSTSGNTWTILRRDGHVLRFGDKSTYNARVDIDNLGTFAWYLHEHEDTMGNQAHTWYYNQGNARVPSQMKYTEHSSLAEAPVRVDFAWLTNGNPKIINCKPGQCANADQRVLERITIYTQEEYTPEQEGYLKRRDIDFSQSFGEIDGHRVLNSIHQTAYRADGTPSQTGTATQIPDVDFEYESVPDPGGNGGTVVIDPSVGQPGCTPEYSEYEWDNDWWIRTKRTMADMNGDGIKDLVLSNSKGSEYWIYPGSVDEWGDLTYEQYNPLEWSIPNSGPPRTDGNVRTTWSEGEPNYPRYTNLRQDLQDINGDGRADWILGFGGLWVAINNGNGFDTKTLWDGVSGDDLRQTFKTSDPGMIPEAVYEFTESLMRDVNGDGRPDMLTESGVLINDPNVEGQFVDMGWGSGCSTPVTIAGCHGWEIKVEAPEAQKGVVYTIKELIDINGDGLPDILFQPDATYPFEDLEELRVCYNNGHGWDDSVSLGLTNHVGISRDSSNGPFKDLPELPESSFSLDGNVNQAEDDGFFGDISNREVTEPTLPREEWAENLFIDWTGDGLPDYLYWDGENNWLMRRNTGKGFAASDESIDCGFGQKGFGLSYTHGSAYPPTIPEFSETVNMHMDLDGDGGLEWVAGDENCQSGNSFGFVRGALPSTLKLKKVINNFGGEVNINYMPANRTQNAQIPIPMSVVTHVTSSEQITNRSHLLTYSYGDGLYEGQSVYVGAPSIFKSPGNKEFRGFRWVEINDSARGTTSHSEFHQDVYKPGKLIFSTVTGPQGDLPEGTKSTAADSISISQTTTQELNSVTPDGVTPLVRYDTVPWPTPQFTYADLKKKTLCLGSQCTTTGKRYTYDTGHGRILTKIDVGKCSTGSCTDTRYTHKTTITYKELLNYNDNRWLVKKKQEILSQYLRQLFTWTWIQQAKQIFYHDSTSNSSTLTEGLLRRVLRYNSSIKGDVGSSIKNYDSLGMVISETDYNTSNPVLTTYVLDPVHGKYVTSKTTAGLTETYSWDYGLGQKVVSIDPNGVETGWVHDGFGRVLEEQWRPSSSDDWQVLVENSYSDFTFQNSGVPVHDHQWSTVDEGEGLISYTRRYYDGTGRLLQEAAKFDGNNGYSRLVAYDGTGRLSCVSKARLENEGAAFEYQGVLNCGSCTDCADYGFDGLDRVRWVRDAVNSDTAVRSFVYGGDLSVSMTDEEGKELKTLSDGWGNIKYVIRDPNGLAQTSIYSYDAGNRITSAKDPENNTISYIRNYLGKITQVNLPNSHQWNFAHDDNGNTIYSQSPENREIDIQYDDLQRVLLKTFTQDNVVEGSNTYTYDSSPEYGLGRLHIANSDAGQA